MELLMGGIKRKKKKKEKRKKKDLIFSTLQVGPREGILQFCFICTVVSGTQHTWEHRLSCD